MKFIGLSMVVALVACGGGGGGGDAVDGGGSDDPVLADRAGCHMLPVAVPQGSGSVCVQIYQPLSGQCFVGNDVGLSCSAHEQVIDFQWEAGQYYTVKTFDWIPVTSSHGTVTTMTNADGGILDIPVSTVVTATFSQISDNATWEVVFRMEDEYVHFESVTETTP